MGKRLIVIHGRSIKPARQEMSRLTKAAIAEGMRRGGFADQALDLESGAIAYDFVYYGHINNEIQADKRPHDRKALTATDPFNGKPCLPIEPLREAFSAARKIKSFTLAQYRKVLDAADDYRFLDEAADFASLIGGLATFGILNTLLVKLATPDMAAYLTSHDVGSTVRMELQEMLEPALKGTEDICLIAHSMGAIVSYDVLWKYSHLSEYEELRKGKPRISQFVTIGCPLGELGVRNNLLDGRYLEAEKYPRDIIRNWWNFHAEDDYIARAEKMRVAFATMRTKGYVEEIRDRHIYNCWRYVDTVSKRLVANPHDFYGYLMHDAVGAHLGAWARKS